MGQRPVIAFILLFGHLLGISVAASDVNFIQNCTVDDLRNINDEYKSMPVGKSPLTLNFVFSDCNLDTITEGVFVNIPSIQSLRFMKSNISAINTDAFSSLKNLMVLSIIGNPNLINLQSWTAISLDKLNELHLQHNGIHDLNTFALRRYPKLIRLNLKDNAIDDIPNGFFDFSLNIEHLNLASNSLQRIESFTLKALLRLVDLNLEYNEIEYIDSYAFTTTMRLKQLRLNGNQLTSINSMVFYNLNRLEYLNISENKLSDYALEEDAFEQNVNLIHLDVSYNSMIGIHAYALSGLRGLQVSEFIKSSSNFIR